MIPTENEIAVYMYDFFKYETFKYFIFVILSLCAAIISFYSFKVYSDKHVWKAIAIVLLTISCAVGLIVIKTIEIFSVYNDYRNNSYTIEENAEIYIFEGINDPLEQRSNVKLKTYDGIEIDLKIIYLLF